LSERFAHAAAFQYYQPIDPEQGLQDFVEFVGGYACEDDNDDKCFQKLNVLQKATYMDIDFDAISHAVVVTAFWAAGPSHKPWPRATIAPFRVDDTTEIGILNNEKAEEPEEIALGGSLTIIGQDEKPGKLMLDNPTVNSD